MTLKKCSIAFIFLALLGLMPYIFLIVVQYNIRSTGLDVDYDYLSAYGQIESPYSKVWTGFITLFGLMLVAKMAISLQVTFRTSLLLFVFFLFVGTVLFSLIQRPEEAARVVGATARYLDYLIIAPLLGVLAARSLRRLPGILYSGYILSAIILIVPEWHNIHWTELGTERHMIVKAIGGMHNAVSESYAAIILLAFIISPLRKGSRRVLGLYSLAFIIITSLSLFLIVASASRGAMLAIVTTLIVYGAQRGFLSNKRIVPLSIFIVVFSIILLYSFSGIFIDSFMYRHGDLDQADAGRSEIWLMSWNAITSSWSALLFGYGDIPGEAPPHNMFLGILLRFGLIALIPYATFHILALGLFWNLARGVGELRSLDLAPRALAAAIGILVAANLNNSFFLNQGPLTFLFYYLVGVAIVIDSQHHKRTSAEQRPRLDHSERIGPLSRRGNDAQAKPVV